MATLEAPVFIRDIPSCLGFCVGSDGTICTVQEDGSTITCISPTGDVSCHELNAPPNTPGEFLDVCHSGDSFYVEHSSGVVFRFKDGEFTFAADFRHRAALHRSAGPFAVSSSGTFFISNLQKNKILVSSPFGEESELEIPASYVRYLAVDDAKNQLHLASGSKFGVLHLGTIPVKFEWVHDVEKPLEHVTSDRHGQPIFTESASSLVVRTLINKLAVPLCHMREAFAPIDEESDMIGLRFAPDGTLFVAFSGLADVSLWAIRGLPCWKGKKDSLLMGMDWYPDCKVSVNGFDLKLHKAFADRRCPSQLYNSSLHSRTVDHASLELFRCFLYSDVLPADIAPLQLMGLAVRQRFSILFETPALT
jgi:hypothetical protein